MYNLVAELCPFLPSPESSETNMAHGERDRWVNEHLDKWFNVSLAVLLCVEYISTIQQKSIAQYKVKPLPYHR